ncbi:MAG: hypothetical protein RR086_05155 [Clostridia bacterium]
MTVLKYIIYIALALAFYFVNVYVGWKFLKIREDQDFINYVFSRSNTITDGAKGTGKDLLFGFVVRDRVHYSNIYYNSNTIIKSVKDFNCGKNTYNNLLSNCILPVDKTLFEHCDFFVSDGGAILPCHMDDELKSLYPSFPLFYAFQRHLYNSNTHINSQSYMRIWKIIREQADGFFRCINTSVRAVFGVTIATTNLIYYSLEKGIANCIQPIRVGLFASQDLKDQVSFQRANYGEIRDLTLVQVLRPDHYDSRAYHTKFFGYKSPTSD